MSEPYAFGASERAALDAFAAELVDRLGDDGVVVLAPLDVEATLGLWRLVAEVSPRLDSNRADDLAGGDTDAGLVPTCVMLDPWYNKGVGGERDDYDDYITGLLTAAAPVAPHVYLWGFPEIIARFVDRIPEPLELEAWLTWYYKNNPSVIRGWRSAQMTCLHLKAPDGVMHPEAFLNEAQLAKKEAGKLRYLPGPPSVIEAGLLVGFIGRAEQTGHPSQKPVKVYDPLVQMATIEGDLVLDPMCGSGTTGAVARATGRRAVLADVSDEYVGQVERRLGITRVEVPAAVRALVDPASGPSPNL
ncbi:MAG TPA: site-specific DNA-methyltransferase [Acidimicrobiales bacterium]|nr:site-specific DNA-methyltransferase [Acidimicrobiales bacterium]